MKKNKKPILRTAKEQAHGKGSFAVHNARMHGIDSAHGN
jgi:hypothetical protein